MPDLELCSGCKRHVHHDEVHCPFCGSILEEPTRRPAPRAKAFTRAALLMAGAAVGTSSLAACGDDEEPIEEGQSGDEDAGAENDGGAIEPDPMPQPAYGVAIEPPDDELPQPAYGVPVDPPPDDDLIVPAYGVPIDPQDAGTPEPTEDAGTEGPDAGDDDPMIQPAYGVPIDPNASDH